MAKITTSGEGSHKSTRVELQFTKLYREERVSEIPEVDGVYVAFACTLDNIDASHKHNWNIKRIIYIGMGTGTDNVHVRVGIHKNEDHPKWRRHLNDGEQIVYTYAECQKTIVHDVEAALIYINQPSENNNSMDEYTGDIHPLTVVCGGKLGYNIKGGVLFRYLI